MSNLLSYLVQSTLCLSLFWLMFRIVMRKEHVWGLARMLLLMIVLISTVIPFIHLPVPMQSPLHMELLSSFSTPVTGGDDLSSTRSDIDEVVANEISTVPTAVGSETNSTLPKLLFYGYLTGCLVAWLVLLRGFFSVLLLTRKARSQPMEGFRLFVVRREIPAFSFGRWVVLSQSDYDHHRLPLLAHEQAHIRLFHFFDLLLLEIVKIVFWFNPVIHWLIREMKEIHEFQADNYTLTKGIDATQYQLLIIQKGVGVKRFALANSFNHCQIKKRLLMINTEKPTKTSGWKVAAFLPLLALLVMAFGRVPENGSPVKIGLTSIGQVFSTDSTKQWKETDFLTLKDFNSMNANATISKWVEPAWSTFTENGKTVSFLKSDYSGPCFYRVKIDSLSQILVGDHKRHLDWSEFQDSIRPWFDFEFANERSKHHFHTTMVNGMMKMYPTCIFLISSDLNTPPSDYQRLLNRIGNTVLEVRGKKSKEIFKIDYAELNSKQRKQIDNLIPLFAMIAKSPKFKPVAKNRKDSLSVATEQADDITFKAEKIVTDTHKRSTLSLYKAQVKYQNINLTADYIELNRDSSLVYATGQRDSTGVMRGQPLLTIGKDIVTAEEIRYNFKKKTGIFYKQTVHN